MMIAFDHLRGEMRDFMASRIRELSVTEEIFDWPAGFDLTASLDSGLVMFRAASHNRWRPNSMSIMRVGCASDRRST
jgi:predicted DNA-binding transcriptional regulator YafY